MMSYNGQETIPNRGFDAAPEPGHPPPAVLHYAELRHSRVEKLKLFNMAVISILAPNFQP